MTIYNVVLFFHILAMLGLMIAVAFQWTMLHSAISARDGEETFRWIRATARLPLLVFPSLVTVLGTGIYMAARTNAFGRGWISASFLSILFIAAVSIVAGPATRALQRYARQEKIEEVRRALLKPLLVAPVRLQFALLLTVTFLMVVRTNLVSSLQIVSVGVASGLLWSVSTWRTGRF
ncbi:MAG TPA: hypothetical protein VK604_24300 [Bryobacteraceae bacterium]|nr:hypothetical protein [Bryobacteraceae bacterium]